MTYTVLTVDICIFELCHCSLVSIESSWSSPGTFALALEAGSLVDTGESKFIRVAVATSPTRLVSSVFELVDWLVSTDFWMSVEIKIQYAYWWIWNWPCRHTPKNRHHYRCRTLLQRKSHQWLWRESSYILYQMTFYTVRGILVVQLCIWW